MAQDYRQLLGSDLLADSRGYLNDSDLALLTEFSGSSAPSSPVAYQRWIDTTTGLVKRRNAANDAWIVIAVLGSAYGGLLPLAGGTMSGDIAMGGQLVTGLGLGTGLAAARQQEVDLKAPLAAPGLTGDAQVDQDPAGNNSLVRRSWAEGRYLKLAGGTMTGALLLSGYAAGASEAVPLASIQQMTTFHTSAGHDHDHSNSKKVKAASLNTESQVAGKILEADGSGGLQWGDLTFTELAWGRVAYDGSIDIAGSGNWTSARAAVGRFDVSFNVGVFSSTPVILATVYHAYDASIGVSSASTTAARIELINSGYVDRGFFFIAFR